MLVLCLYETFGYVCVCACTVIGGRRQRTKKMDAFHRLCSLPCPPLKVEGFDSVWVLLVVFLFVTRFFFERVLGFVRRRWCACLCACLCVCACAHEVWVRCVSSFTLGGGWKSSQGTRRWRITIRLVKTADEYRRWRCVGLPAGKGRIEFPLQRRRCTCTCGIAVQNIQSIRKKTEIPPLEGCWTSTIATACTCTCGWCWCGELEGSSGGGTGERYGILFVLLLRLLLARRHRNVIFGDREQRLG